MFSPKATASFILARYNEFSEVEIVCDLQAYC